MKETEIQAGKSYIGRTGQVRKVISIHGPMARYEVTRAGYWRPGSIVSTILKKQNLVGYVARVQVTTLAQWADQEVAA